MRDGWRKGEMEAERVNVLIFLKLCVCFMHSLGLHRWDKNLLMLSSSINVLTVLYFAVSAAISVHE